MNKWVIAAACSFVAFLAMGTARLMPILYVEFMVRYHVDRESASLPLLLSHIFRTISGPAVGLAGKKFEYGAVMIFGCFLGSVGIGCCFFAEDILAITVFWGCLFGLGFGFATALLSVVIDKHFDAKNNSKANGIASAGSSLGAIVLPPLFEAIIREYGLSGSFLIACGFLLQAIPASLLISVANKRTSCPKGVQNAKQGQDETTMSEMESFHPVAVDQGSSTVFDCKEPTTTDSVSIKEISSLKTLMLFLDPTFFLIAFTQGLFSTKCLMLWTILLDFVRDVGVDRDTEVYCIILLPITDMAGRLSLGWVTDRGYLTTIQFSVVLYAFMGLITFLFTLVHNLVTVLIVIGFYGFASGGVVPVLPRVISEFIVPEYKVMALASRLIFMAPLGCLAPRLIGYFRETRGSYAGIFYVCCGISLLCSGLSTLIPGFSKRSRAKFVRNEMKTIR